MVRRWLCAMAYLASFAPVLRAQSSSGSVDVRVAVRVDGVAEVEQQYVLAPGSPVTLRLLTRPCVAIESIHLERDGRLLAPVEESSGLWLSWRDTTAASSDTFRLTARYLVHLGGERPRLPLLHLSTPLAGAAQAGGAIHTTVRFADSADAVLFPHMTRQAPDTWEARFVAMPSFLRVRRTGASIPCMTGDAVARSDGGMLTRFVVLVVIMMAWVPAYLSWARRSGEAAD